MAVKCRGAVEGCPWMNKAQTFDEMKVDHDFSGIDLDFLA
jgi:hypothetical protein